MTGPKTNGIRYIEYMKNIALDINAKVKECLKPINSLPFLTTPTNIPVNSDVNVNIKTASVVIILKSAVPSLLISKNLMEIETIKGKIKINAKEINIIYTDTPVINFFLISLDSLKSFAILSSIVPT